MRRLKITPMRLTNGAGEEAMQNQAGGEAEAEVELASIAK